MLLTIKAKAVFIASLIVGISLASSPVASAQEGPCLGISDKNPYPSYESTINPFPRNQLPPGIFGGELDQGLVRTWNPNSNVNLRQQANTSSQVLRNISDRSVIPLYGGYYSEDNYWWWFTEYEGKKGWIRSDYVCGDPQ
ncbi:SH3 domain-containing protein [Crocosphaera sp.]|uniref:SH3 domain-containing protein n=1 Tax=Crocosphaera sp. TaxID=2729996 RepID=UPI00261B11E7|nr:SH3 domain-containing protein [Crocosphaera sp.]MDJ0578775.1 SH3 domain-containing protein [Crocosphaera sp.]